MLKLVITFYCACVLCTGHEPGHRLHKITKSGAIAQEGVTAACSKDRLGQIVEIGHIEPIRLICQDTGGAIKGNRIDIYVESHEKALKLGVWKAVGKFVKRS